MAVVGRTRTERARVAHLVPRLILAVIVLASAACAPTSVQTTSQVAGFVPRPTRILVYDFAVTPQEVDLDTGLSAEVMQYIQQSQGSSRTAQEIKVGHAVANAAAAEIVKEIQGFGLPAERGFGWPPAGGTTLMIKGQFLSIDEGNRSERVLIGLGAGRTSVPANVEVYELTAQGTRTIETMRADAKSGRKPGMAETMGVGALAGNLATSAVVSGVLATSSELSWATVEADGRRLGKDVAKKLGAFFVNQGWIAPGSVN